MDKDFKDYIDSKTQGDVLLQLLVFEHAGIGRTTIQTEHGALLLSLGGQLNPFFASVDFPFGVVREAIDKAVAEQFGRKLEPPYLRRKGSNYYLRTANEYQLLSFEAYDALTKINNYKPLPVVDAAESSPKSVWTQVFPSDQYRSMATPFIHEIIHENQWKVGYNDCLKDMQKETAFTVWRLTVSSIKV